MEKHDIGSVAAAASYMTRLLERASKEDMAGGIFLDPKTVGKLRELVGAFVDGMDLAGRVQRLGSIKVQGREWVLTSDQIARLKQEAFGHARDGEPRSEKQATPEQAKTMVNRYLDEQLDYYVKMMCSQL